MTIILPTLAVAFATFCVWLWVRILNRVTGDQAGPLWIWLVVAFLTFAAGGFYYAATDNSAEGHFAGKMAGVWICAALATVAIRALRR